MKKVDEEVSERRMWLYSSPFPCAFLRIPVGKRLLERTLKRDKGMFFECTSLFRKTKTLIRRRERDFLNDPKWWWWCDDWKSKSHSRFEGARRRRASRNRECRKKKERKKGAQQKNKRAAETRSMDSTTSKSSIKNVCDLSDAGDDDNDDEECAQTCAQTVF